MVRQDLFILLIVSLPCNSENPSSELRIIDQRSIQSLKGKGNSEISVIEVQWILSRSVHVLSVR